jgi:hypothetical protein
VVAGPFSQTETLPAQTIRQFLADPSALFKKYPNGGPQLLTRVREVAADPATLNTIVGLIQSANPNQANAIRTGGAKGGHYANRIQEAIAKAEIISDVSAGKRSTRPKIVSAVTTKNQVEGVTKKGNSHLWSGPESTSTNWSGPVTREWLNYCLPITLT